MSASFHLQKDTSIVPTEVKTKFAGEVSHNSAFPRCCFPLPDINSRGMNQGVEKSHGVATCLKLIPISSPAVGMFADIVHR